VSTAIPYTDATTLDLDEILHTLNIERTARRAPHFLNQLIDAISHDDPQDLFYPSGGVPAYPRFRPAQRILIPELVRIALLENSNRTAGPLPIVILELPPGSGKSDIVTLATSAHVTDMGIAGSVVTATKDLQRQYELLGGVPLMGRANYPCVNQEVVDKALLAGVRRLITVDDCPFEPMLQCPVSDRCEYVLAKRRTLYAPFALFNYAWLWWGHAFTKTRLQTMCALAHLLIYDEAHSLDSIGTSMSGITLSRRDLDKWNLTMPPTLNGSSSTVLHKASNWLQSNIDLIAQKRLQAAQYWGITKADPSVTHELIKLMERMEYVRASLPIHAASAARYHVHADHNGLDLRPLRPSDALAARFFNRTFLTDLTTIVVMSATLGPVEGVLDQLGIADDYAQGRIKLYTYTGPHFIPPAHRPVYYIDDAPKISKRSTDADYARQADLIAQAIQTYHAHATRQRTVMIHTVSWMHTRTLIRLLQARGVATITQDRDLSRADAIDAIRDLPEGSVVISPSLNQGYNPLPSSTPGLIIIAKTPFPSLADPIVRERQRLPGGGSWYFSEAAKEIVQGSGRGLRLEGDRAITLIIDKAASMVFKRFPQWYAATLAKIPAIAVDSAIVSFCQTP